MINGVSYKALAILDEIKRIAPHEPEPSILKGYNIWDEWWTKGREGRKEFIEKYGWAIPTKEAIEKIATFVQSDTLLEVGAGSGLWAFLLQAMDIDVIATDSKDHGTYKNTWEEFTPVQTIYARAAVRRYKQANALMFVWPYMHESISTRVISIFKGNKVIYVGEGQGGCTALDGFFRILKHDYNKVATIDIPQWAGLHDYVSLWERKNA